MLHLKFVTDGTHEGTYVCDARTGEKLHGIQVVECHSTAHSYTKLKLELIYVDSDIIFGVNNAYNENKYNIEKYRLVDTVEGFEKTPSPLLRSNQKVLTLDGEKITDGITNRTGVYLSDVHVKCDTDELVVMAGYSGRDTVYKVSDENTHE